MKTGINPALVELTAHGAEVGGDRITSQYIESQTEKCLEGKTYRTMKLYLRRTRGSVRIQKGFPEEVMFEARSGVSRRHLGSEGWGVKGRAIRWGNGLCKNHIHTPAVLNLRTDWNQLGIRLESDFLNVQLPGFHSQQS